MQIGTIAGNVGKDAETRSTQQGDQFCRFTVAVTTGWGDRKATTWWDVTRWGKGADKLAGFVTKGAKVAVSGEISTREHEGKTYLQIRADHVTLQGGGSDDHQYRGSTAQQSVTNRDFADARGERVRSGAGENHATRQAASAGFRDDLDDDVPF